IGERTPPVFFALGFLWRFEKLTTALPAHTYVDFPVEASHPRRAHFISLFANGWHPLFCFQSSFHPTFLLASPNGMTLIFFFLSTGNRDSKLQFPIFIIHSQRHYCQPLLAFRRGYVGYFFLGEQEPARALRVVRFWCIGYLPGGDGRAHEVRFAAASDDTRAFQGTAPGAERLHFKSEQFQTGLHLFDNGVIKFHAYIFYECHCITIQLIRLSAGI